MPMKQPGVSDSSEAPGQRVWSPMGSGWEVVYCVEQRASKIHIHLEPQNVTLFIDKVFVDVVC